MAQVTDFPNVGQSLAQMAMQSRDQNQRANETFLQVQSQTNQLTMGLLNMVMDKNFRNRNLDVTVEQSNLDRGERGRIADQSEAGINTRFGQELRDGRERFDASLKQNQDQWAKEFGLKSDEFEQRTLQANREWQSQQDRIMLGYADAMNSLNQQQEDARQIAELNDMIFGTNNASNVGIRSPYVRNALSQLMSRGMSGEADEARSSMGLMDMIPGANSVLAPGEVGMGRQDNISRARGQSGFPDGPIEIVGSDRRPGYELPLEGLDPSDTQGGLLLNPLGTERTSATATFTRWRRHLEGLGNALTNAAGGQGEATKFANEFLSGTLASNGAITETGEKYYNARIDRLNRGGVLTSIKSWVNSDETNEKRANERGREAQEFMEIGANQFIADQVVKRNPELKGLPIEELLAEATPMERNRGFEKAYPKEARQAMEGMTELRRITNAFAMAGSVPGGLNAVLESRGGRRNLVNRLERMQKRLDGDGYMFFNSKDAKEFAFMLENLRTEIGVPVQTLQQQQAELGF